MIQDDPFSNTRVIKRPGPKIVTMITDKQRQFIIKLLEERPGFPKAEILEAQAQSFTMPRHSASTLIDLLLKTPRPRTTYTPDPDSPASNMTPVVIRDGTYTLVLPNGDYRTLQFRTKPATAEFAPGEQIILYLSGPDNDLSFTSCGILKKDGRIIWWKKFRADSDSQLRRDVEEFIRVNEAGRLDAHERFLDQAESYALSSGNCMVCCRTLTVPASINRGIGPVCAQIERW